MSSKWFRDNKAEFSGQLSFDEPLMRHTYYRIGGNASVFAIPKTVSDILWLVEGINQSQVPFFVLGKGSNLLVSDAGYAGVVIDAGRMGLEIEPVLGGTAGVETPHDVVPKLGQSFHIRTGASVAISSLLRRASHEGWKGLEFLTGIPGSVGGAIFMNAGTHLGETKDRLRRVEVFLLKDGGKRIVYEGSDLKYQYRKNLFLPEGSLIGSAEWEVEKAPSSEVSARIQETLKRRKETQPIDYPSCGSVFKNPKAFGTSAWKVIDQLGLRGHRIGGAQFAEKHSNFIINLGGARAADVRGLIDLAKSRAFKELGIVLEEEVIYLGG